MSPSRELAKKASIACRSYVWPALLMTGSLNMVRVIGHRKSAGVSKSWWSMLMLPDCGGVTGAAKPTDNTSGSLRGVQAC